MVNNIKNEIAEKPDFCGSLLLAFICFPFVGMLIIYPTLFIVLWILTASPGDFFSGLMSSFMYLTRAVIWIAIPISTIELIRMVIESKKNILSPTMFWAVITNVNLGLLGFYFPLLLETNGVKIVPLSRFISAFHTLF